MMYEGEVVGNLSVLLRELANLEADFSVSFKSLLGKPRRVAYVSVEVENCFTRTDPAKLKALLNRNVRALRYPAGWSPTEDLFAYYERLDRATRQARLDDCWQDRWTRTL